jgi:phosphatidylglycerol---prolipoprotein diacylglyceryl transferase
MHPILFEIGRFPVYTYGVLLAAAYLLGLQFALVRARTRGLDPNRVMDLGIWIIISALVGAKLLLLVVEFDKYTSNPSELRDLLRSGGVFYGGLIAAVVVALWYLRRHRMPMWTVTDVFAPGIALGHVIGRMGCLFAGCCFGRPTDVPWAITFHSEYAAQNVGTPLDVPLHPTQLYEGGAELLILVLLLATERRGRTFPGRTFWAYMFLYGVSRFIIEFYRGDPRGTVGMFSTSQFLSMIIVPLAIVMLVVLGRRAAGPTPQASARRARAA